MLPDSTSRTRSASQSGSSVSSACAVVMKPGVQKPHCSAWCLRKDFCSGVRSASLDRPSTVTTLRAFGLHREHQAGAHRLAVDQHGAGAADAVLAADMGAGEPQLVAQAIGQRQARLDVDADLLAVDLEFASVMAFTSPPRL